MVVEPIAVIFVDILSWHDAFVEGRLIESLFFFLLCDGKNRGGLPEKDIENLSITQLEHGSGTAKAVSFSHLPPSWCRFSYYGGFRVGSGS